MLGNLLPDAIFDDIYKITPEFLTGEGIGALILDIDNTLVTYEDPKPTEKVRAWLDLMKRAGIKTAFVSNNHIDRVGLFCEGLGCYYRAGAGKPSRRFLRAAMAHMGSGTGTTAAVGDQLFTDVWAAKRCGMRAYLVAPIKDRLTLFFRFKRLLERPFIRRYYKKKETETGKWTNYTS